MGYIIVWRNNGSEPFIELDSHYFKEEYSSYEDAVKEAEELAGGMRPINYAIYEEVTS